MDTRAIFSTTIAADDDQRHLAQHGQLGVGDAVVPHFDGPRYELRAVEQPEQDVGQEEVDHRGHEQAGEELRERRDDARVQCDEQVLGVPDGAHGAAGGDRERQGQ